MRSQVSPGPDEIVDVQDAPIPPGGMQSGVFNQISLQFTNEFAPKIAPEERWN
ncbi:hypothetical protein FRC20_002539 [Serendipita sp. 405]|nr:hypothetical protein FRC20_002539 [Serendipita sp. 405]